MRNVYFIEDTHKTFVEADVLSRDYMCNVMRILSSSVFDQERLKLTCLDTEIS